MIVCVALALAIAPLEDIPALAVQLEQEARVLRADAANAPPPMLAPRVHAFADDAKRLSDSLRASDVAEDLPCMFKGMSEDAHRRADGLLSADAAARAEAGKGLGALLDDAVLFAPMAAKEAAEKRRAALR